MCLSYIEYAIIIAMDGIDVSSLRKRKGKGLWEIYEDRLIDHPDDDVLRSKIDSLIHSTICSINTNFVVVGEWNIACVMIHLRNGNRRYTEVACRQLDDGSIRVFAAAKRRGVPDIDCPCVPVMFRADGWDPKMPENWGLIGLNRASLQEVFDCLECPRRPTVGQAP